ncbi:hypothetical protein [Vibrio alfacsensis]|uniref:hypothetical protein n=1 Tax=Vibrio alfacsensis TaxID=1074311 RepID=UPI004067EDE3
MYKLRVDVTQLKRLVDEIDFPSLLMNSDLKNTFFIVSSGELILCRGDGAFEFNSNAIMVRCDDDFIFEVKYASLKSIVDVLACKIGFVDINLHSDGLDIKGENFEICSQFECKYHDYFDVLRSSDTFYNVNLDTIESLLTKSLTSIEEYRNNIKGLHVDHHDGETCFVTTNGHVASINKLDSTFYPFAEDLSISIDVKTLESMLRFLKCNEKYVIGALFEQGKVCLNSSGGAKFRASVDDSDYRDWKGKIFDKIDGDYLIRVDKSHLIDFCIMAKQINGKGGVIIELKGNDVVLTYECDGFNLKSCFEVKVKSEANFKVKINLDYFFKALSSIRGSIVKISFGEGVVFSELSESGYYQRLVLPVQI